MTKPDATIRLDLNNSAFQEHLLTLQKAERHAALDTLNKLRQLTWNQLYRDQGLKWEKITSIKPPKGIDTAMVISCVCSRSPQITMPPTARNNVLCPPTI
jgi:hypothetical protein